MDAIPEHDTRSGAKYTTSIIVLHWLTFILLMGSYLSIELRTLFERGSDPRELMKYIHFVIGLSILSLTLLRLAARFKQAPLPPLQDSPHFLNLAARYGHYTLYVFLLVMPILGWLIVSAEGKTISILGLALPSLMPANAAAADFLEETHELVGKIGYFLIGSHIAFALYHHYVRKDKALSRISGTQ